MTSTFIDSVDFTRGTFEHSLDCALIALVRDGVVKLERVCDPCLIDLWLEQLQTTVLPQVVSGRFPYRNRPLGHKRMHYILEIQRRFNSPDFYAVPAIYRLVQKVLDDDFLLMTVAVAYAEPGSLPQHVHRDVPLLFPAHKINGALPAASITVGLPLIDTDDRARGTEFQLGSHRLNSSNATFLHTSTRKGDCIVWDSRVMHRGRANTSGVARPMILFYFQRPWFFNFRNYSQDAEVKITDIALERVPTQYRHLFDWVRRLFPAPLFGPDASGFCGCGSGLLYSDCHQLA